MADVQASIKGVTGFQVAGVHAGLKKDGKLDFALVVSDRPCATAGVFTTNRVKAAPVIVDVHRLEENAGGIRAVAINTKSANACTGQLGIENALETARYAAEKIGCSEKDVLVMSTGVIGAHLPIDKIKQGVDIAVPSLSNDWDSAAAAIMTTDTRPKSASLTVTTASGQSYTIAGISKGAGMIAPNMATMLSVVVTDAVLTADQAKKTLRAASNISYNRIVIDGDMSTNDTVFLLANGASGIVMESSDDLTQFQAALDKVCTKLAQEVVRDGEGVTKFITLQVLEAPDEASAMKIANAVATSPLVKTAFFGRDANWGRIVAAAGRSGVDVVPEKLRLLIAAGEGTTPEDQMLLLFENGTPTNFNESDSSAIFTEPSVTIVLRCGLGEASATVWTCDLSHDYVSINGDYRS